MRLINMCALFLGAAAVSAWTFYPAKSEAAWTWRQYSTLGCKLSSSSSPAGAVVGTTFVNDSVPAPGAELNGVTADCPIVEDESVHGKGNGVRVQAVFEQYSNNYSSWFTACKIYQGAVGGTCSAEVRTSAGGINAVTLFPAASDWESGVDFGYLHFGVGSKAAAANTANRLKGYWLSHP